MATDFRKTVNDGSQIFPCPNVDESPAPLQIINDHRLLSFIKYKAMWKQTQLFQLQGNTKLQLQSPHISYIVLQQFFPRLGGTMVVMILSLTVAMESPWIHLHLYSHSWTIHMQIIDKNVACRIVENRTEEWAWFTCVVLQQFFARLGWRMVLMILSLAGPTHT